MTYRSRVWIILGTVALAAKAPTLFAQERFASEKCRSLVAVARGGGPVAGQVRDYHLLAECGSVASDAIAEGLRVSRRSTDLARLERLSSPVRDKVAPVVVNAALEVADDREASMAARVYAIRALWWYRWPGPVLNLEDVASGTPVSSCYYDLTTPHDPKPQRDSALAQRIRSIARKLASDANEHETVRFMAMCLVPEDFLK